MDNKTLKDYMAPAKQDVKAQILAQARDAALTDFWDKVKAMAESDAKDRSFGNAEDGMYALEAQLSLVRSAQRRIDKINNPVPAK